MQILLEMGPEFQTTLAEMSAMGRDAAAAVSEGLGKAVIAAADNVGRNFLTGQSLKARSGDLRQAVQGWKESQFDGVVGVRADSKVGRYKWLLGDETKTITPKSGKFLAIPIGEALAGSGVVKSKYQEGPRSVTDGFFVRTNGRLLFGYKVGKKGKFRALFTLVPSVTVIGSGALADGVLDSADDMAAIVQNEVNKAIA